MNFYFFGAELVTFKKCTLTMLREPVDGLRWGFRRETDLNGFDILGTVIPKNIPIRCSSLPAAPALAASSNTESGSLESYDG